MRASSPPSGFSILITSAPMSAMITPASGPASAWPTSITRTPSSGKLTSDPPLLPLSYGARESNATACGPDKRNPQRGDRAGGRGTGFGLPEPLCAEPRDGSALVPVLRASRGAGTGCGAAQQERGRDREGGDQRRLACRFG